nr:hypothetical protein [Rhizobium mesoamericanum]
MLPIGISSCTTDRLKKSATVQGKIAAGINLPAWPDDCRELEAHASVDVGSELRSVLVRERSALDRQNARTGRCAAFYDDVQNKYAGR